MGRKGKLRKFAELSSFGNVFQADSATPSKLFNSDNQTVDYKGRWSEDFFSNNNPITVELACGKGEYTLGLAQRNPHGNFIGVDIKGARIWKGAKSAWEQNKSNVAFVRARIEHLHHYFGANEISEIWITFPDPFLRESRADKRLTSPKFITRYQPLIAPDGVIHLKTDSPELFEFTLKTIRDMGLQVIDKIENVYQENVIAELTDIQTFYEKMHLLDGRVIRYISFHPNSD